MYGLADVQRKMVVESSTTLDRKWLTLTPYFQPIRLSDHKISTGVHFRTLVPGHN